MPLEFGVFQGASVGPRPWDTAAHLGVNAQVGDSVENILAPGPHIRELSHALISGKSTVISAVSRALTQLRMRVEPVSTGALLVLEPDPAEDRIGFAEALQEIARAGG